MSAAPRRPAERGDPLPQRRASCSLSSARTGSRPAYGADQRVDHRTLGWHPREAYAGYPFALRAVGGPPTPTSRATCVWSCLPSCRSPLPSSCVRLAGAPPLLFLPLS
eukprot:UN2295